jgi:hypothetical protein
MIQHTHGQTHLIILFLFDSEEREYGVGDGVNDTKMSETLKIVGVTEDVVREFLL